MPARRDSLQYARAPRLSVASPRARAGGAGPACDAQQRRARQPILACLAQLIVVALNHLARAGNVTISQCGTASFLSEPLRWHLAKSGQNCLETCVAGGLECISPPVDSNTAECTKELALSFGMACQAVRGGSWAAAPHIRRDGSCVHQTSTSAFACEPNAVLAARLWKQKVQRFCPCVLRFSARATREGRKRLRLGKGANSKPESLAETKAKPRAKTARQAEAEARAGRHLDS